VSILGHPFASTLVMVAGTALRIGTLREALRAVLLVAAVAVLPVAALMARQVRRGAWANVDASDRAERPVLFAVGMVALAALLVTLAVLRPGSFLVRGAIGVLIMLAVCAAATRWIKVSLHMAFGLLAAATLVSLGSTVGWIWLAFTPVVAWSRLALGRHRPVEVALGAAVGAAFGLGIAHL
jgi:hypothetical protein